MSSTQVWTALGIIAGSFATMIGLVLLVVSSKFQTLSTQITDVGKRIDDVGTRIGDLTARVQAVETVLMKPPGA